MEFITIIVLNPRSFRATIQKETRGRNTVMIGEPLWRIWMSVPLLCLFACCGSSYSSLVDTSYGDAGMGETILVVYGTRAGSTAEVADVVGRILAEGGVRVDVKPVGSVKNLDGYSAVVIGTAIRAGKVKSGVLNFVKNCASELRSMPVAVFVVCMTMKDDTPENRKTVGAYLDPVREWIDPVEVGLFAGKMDYASLGFFARFAVQHVVKVPEGDVRNWSLIEDWSRNLRARLVTKNGGS